MQEQESQLGCSLSILPLASPPPARLLVPPRAPLPPQTSVTLAERLIPFSQSAWKKRENSLPGGRGVAEVTSRRLFWKEMPRTSPTGFPGKGSSGYFGEIGMGCAGWSAPHFLCLTFPPPLCTTVSLLLHFCATLLTFQKPRQ